MRLIAPWRPGQPRRRDGRGEPRCQPISILAAIASLTDEGLRDAGNITRRCWRRPSRTSLTTRRSRALVGRSRPRRATDGAHQPRRRR
jgi:hypothetical protein